MLDRADIVIVGNGIAGLTAAVEARRLAPEKSIMIVTRQSHPTINTPALKQFMINKVTREQLLAYPTGTERAQRIHVVDAEVEEICSREHTIRLHNNRQLGYGSLLLATGGHPTGLPPALPGRNFDGVLTLHSLEDYLDLRRRLSDVKEAVVIGGGVHAIETVMGLLHLGIRVHWLIRSETLMPRNLDGRASEMVLEGIRNAGAKIYTKTEVVGIVGRIGIVAGVVTTQEQMLPCQLVLVCTGTAPVTALAKRCDVPISAKQGILVNEQLRTSVPDIYAAGDVAALRDPLTGTYAPRAQWYAAVLQSRAVAASMVGAYMPDPLGVPWHATRLGELTMLTVGQALASTGPIISLTEQRKGSYYRLAVADDRLVGYLALGTNQPDSLAIKRLVDEGFSIREIKKDLLRGEFDSQRFFAGKHTYTLRRWMTTGQLPTPLPPLPEYLAEHKHDGSRNAPQESVLSLVAGGEQARPSQKEAPQDPATRSLVPAARSGTQPRRPETARPEFLSAEEHKKQRIAAQMTLVGTDPLVFPEMPLAEQQDEGRLHPRPHKQTHDVFGDMLRVPGRQFLSPPAPAVNSARKAETPANPHPTRSIWHYTNRYTVTRKRRHAGNNSHRKAAHYKEAGMHDNKPS